MQKHGFVYLWYDRKLQRFYIGCRWGREDDGYICSSSWMKQAYKKRPADFKRRVLVSNILCKKELLDEEHKWLAKIKPAELGIRYYNLNNHRFGHWSANEESSMIVREKIKNAESRKQKISEAMKGREFSEEHRAKIRESKIGKKLSIEHRESIGKGNQGKVFSQQRKDNIVNALTGLRRGPMSEEHRAKISAALKKSNKYSCDLSRESSEGPS